MMDEAARQQELVALKSAYGDFSDLSDGNFAHFTGLLTAYMRALESNHKNAMFTDPFANMLAGKEADALTKFIMHAMNMEEQTYACWKTLVAFRTRFADTALLQRPVAVKQVVLLGAGLDARAFRMETLRDCKVFELDAGTAMQDRKANIFAEHDVKPIAKDYHVIIRDLEELGWEQELLVQGYDPQVPTFWLLEGLLMYMTQPNIVKLLEQIDGISAPDSQMWADVTTHREFSDFHDGEASGHWKALNSNDDDPLHGVLTTLKWKLEVQADLSKPGEFFGRSWSPTSSEASGDKPTPGSTIEHFFMLATKPDSKIP